MFSAPNASMNAPAKSASDAARLHDRGELDQLLRLLVGVPVELADDSRPRCTRCYGRRVVEHRAVLHETRRTRCSCASLSQPVDRAAARGDLGPERAHLELLRAVGERRPALRRAARRPRSTSVLTRAGDLGRHLRHRCPATRAASALAVARGVREPWSRRGGGRRGRRRCASLAHPRWNARSASSVAESARIRARLSRSRACLDLGRRGLEQPASAFRRLGLRVAERRRRTTASSASGTWSAAGPSKVIEPTADPSSRGESIECARVAPRSARRAHASRRGRPVPPAVRRARAASTCSTGSSPAA